MRGPVASGGQSGRVTIQKRSLWPILSGEQARGEAASEVATIRVLPPPNLCRCQRRRGRAFIAACLIGCRP